MVPPLRWGRVEAHGHVQSVPRPRRAPMIWLVAVCHMCVYRRDGVRSCGVRRPRMGQASASVPVRTRGFPRPWLASGGFVA